MSPAALDFDRCYAAVSGRDARFDGQFVTAAFDTLSDLPELLARVRRLFDLDADPVAVDQALAGDSHLAASVAAAPGLRIPGATDSTEMLVRVP